MIRLNKISVCGTFFIIASNLHCVYFDISCVFVSVFFEAELKHENENGRDAFTRWGSK